jgi:hypothetical protein
MIEMLNQKSRHIRAWNYKVLKNKERINYILFNSKNEIKMI